MRECWHFFAVCVVLLIGNCRGQAQQFPNQNPQYPQAGDVNSDVNLCRNTFSGGELSSVPNSGGSILNPILNLLSNTNNNNPCVVTCSDPRSRREWMVAKANGATCFLSYASNAYEDRRCFMQQCVIRNTTLDQYCASTLNKNVNTILSLQPYGCSVACYDLTTPAAVMVLVPDNTPCHVMGPGSTQMTGRCYNGACSVPTAGVSTRRGFGFPMFNFFGNSNPSYPNNNQGFPFSNIGNTNYPNQRYAPSQRYTEEPVNDNNGTTSNK